MNRFCLSMDVDWAHDAVIHDTLDILADHDIRATLFVTHDTTTHQRMRDDGHDLGLPANQPNVCVGKNTMMPGEIDAGPGYGCRHIKNSSNLYGGNACQWLDEAIPAGSQEAVRKAVDPQFQPQSRSEIDVEPLRCHPRRPEDGAIRWSDSADQIQRLVRASSRPFAGAFAMLENEQKVIIWRARTIELNHHVLAVPGQIVGRAPDGSVRVACGKGVLEIEDAELESGDKLPASNHYQLTCGRVAAQ